MLRYTKIDLGIFPYDVMAVLTPSLERFTSFVQMQDANWKAPEHWDDEQPAAACCTRWNGGPSIIWLREPPTTPAAIGSLAHECCHAAVAVLDFAGVPIEARNDETMAYTVGHLVKTILARF